MRWVRARSASHELGIERPRLGDVVGPLDDRAAVGEDGELVALGGEPEHERVVADLAQRRRAAWPSRRSSGGSGRGWRLWTALRPQRVVVCEPIAPSSHSNLRCLAARAIDLAEQPGDLERRNVQSQTSTMISSRLSVSRSPLRSLIASTASNEAITRRPGRARRPSRRCGVMPGGGAVSITQRRQGVLPGMIVIVWPSLPITPPIDPGLAQLHRRVVDQVAGLEVVGAVEDQVGVADQVEDVGVVDVGDDRLDRRSAVDLPELPRGGLGLGQVVGDVLLVEEDLALEVVGLDEVAVDDPEMADAGAGQVVGQHGPERPAAAERDPARHQARAGLAEGGEADLAL